MWTRFKEFLKPFLGKETWVKALKSKYNIYYFPLLCLVLVIADHPVNPLLWIAVIWWATTIVFNYRRIFEE